MRLSPVRLIPLQDLQIRLLYTLFSRSIVHDADRGCKLSSSLVGSKKLERRNEEVNIKQIYQQMIEMKRFMCRNGRRAGREVMAPFVLC